MDAQEIGQLGRELMGFLAEFDDCFGRSEPREQVRTYVRGQLSDLPRKSIEPIALAAGTPPRTLQRFLESVRWDERRMRDRLQRIVARDHAHLSAIGAVDESGYPKKGRHTAAVKRQWCGNTGKIDNCLVGVHLSYVAADFQCLLDSDVYLPKDWANDPARRKEAHIPDEAVYRKKTDIALAEIRRALGNGIRVAAWTFDEWYGRDGAFLDGLSGLGQNYVGEVPSTFTGWVHEPHVLLRPRPQDMRKRGRKRRFPRLARKALPACEVRNLLTYSRVFQKQRWRRFHIKDGERGPMVWEVKHARFYRKGRDGLPGPMHCLIVARNVLQPDEVKYFLSNWVPGSEAVSLEWLLWVAFSRWPIEHCFKQAKNELGMDHFEVRGWRSIHRHFYITQLSHLFCARVHQRHREKNDRDAIPDRRAGSPCGLRMDWSAGPTRFGATAEIPGGSDLDRLSPKPQSAGSEVPREKHAPTIATIGRTSRSVEVLYAG